MSILKNFNVQRNPSTFGSNSLTIKIKGSLPNLENYDIYSYNTETCKNPSLFQNSLQHLQPV